MYIGCMICVLMLNSCTVFQRMREGIAKKIDVDISIDYIRTDSLGNEDAISIVDLDKIEEILLNDQ